MEIIRTRPAVLDRLATAQSERRPILCPNAETPEEMEAIVEAAQLHAAETGAARICVGIGITGAYPEHAQLERMNMGAEFGEGGTLVSPAASDLRPRGHLWLDWLDALARRSTALPAVEAIPFLDHGWVQSWADLQLMNDPEFQERFGIVMFDASALDLEENIAETRAYVGRAGHAVVVEGCPDKILSQPTAACRLKPADSGLTHPDIAERFVRETGVDLIVPSLGTEHRGQPAEDIYYRRELARTIAFRLGPIQALHGTSSLGERIGTVGQDGICKVNYYTGMALAASEALRAHWPNFQPLDIRRAAGSYGFCIRRKAARETCLAMLRLLHPAAE